MAKKRTKAKTGMRAVAKIGVAAKAIYQRKKTTTEVIPPDVSRAKAHAWLDLISPITEWAGLRGDQIRHRRELLRIQREDVLTTITLRALQRLDQIAKPVVPIPNKFVVPFLEKASLEQPDSDLIDTWVSLLASAATDFDPHMVRFCTILSEIGVAEVQFLHRLCREARGSAEGLDRISDVPMTFSANELTRQITRSIDTSEDPGDNIDRIVEDTELPGGILMVLGITNSDEPAEVAHELDGKEWESSISLLQSLGLIENHMLIAGEIESYSWYGETVSLTSFGVAFVSACDPEIRDAFRKREEWLRDFQSRQSDIEDFLASDTSKSKE